LRFLVIFLIAQWMQFSLKNWRKKGELEVQLILQIILHTLDLCYFLKKKYIHICLQKKIGFPWTKYIQQSHENSLFYNRNICFLCFSYREVNVKVAKNARTHQSLFSGNIFFRLIRYTFIVKISKIHIAAPRDAVQMFLSIAFRNIVGHFVQWFNISWVQ